MAGNDIKGRYNGPKITDKTPRPYANLTNDEGPTKRYSPKHIQGIHPLL